MWPFMKQQKTESSERLEKVEKDLRDLAHQILRLETDQNNLRGQFNRKLKGIAEFEIKHGPVDAPEKPPKKEEPQDLNSQVPQGIGNGVILRPFEPTPGK